RDALHRILEISRAIEGRDARGELLRDAEMARAPGDLFTHADEPRRFARDRFFVRVRHRLHVQIEIARRVEATLDGSVDPRDDRNRFHSGAELPEMMAEVLVRQRSPIIAGEFSEE